MGYFCLKCGDIYHDIIRKTVVTYDKDGSTEEWIHCPKINCIGQVIEVDDMFLPIIKLLNEKGYFTSYCCSGHIKDCRSNTYIVFDNTIQGLPSIPEGYIESKDDGKYEIRKEYNKNLSDYEYHIKLLENAIVTMKWVESLDNLKKEYINNIMFK
jgi:hypothetical protein